MCVQAEQKYNPYTNQFETVRPNAVLKYNPHENEWRFAAPNATPKYNAMEKEHKMTETQKENWITQDELKKKFSELETEVKPLIKKAINDKQKLITDEYQKFQNYMIVGLYLLNEPRRLLDYTEMKVKNFDKEKDNYFDKSKFVFNQYKTAKYTGKQEVKVDAKLRYIIKIRKLLDDNDYLLIDSKKNKLTPVKLNQRLNKIFGKKIGASLLRHSFISEFLKDVPALEKMTEIANNMGHSLTEQLKYKKN